MYRIETRDIRERWHRPRVPQYLTFAKAVAAASELLYGTSATAFRIVNTETRAVEYTELRRA